MQFFHFKAIFSGIDYSAYQAAMIIVLPTTRRSVKTAANPVLNIRQSVFLCGLVSSKEGQASLNGDRRVGRSSQLLLLSQILKSRCAAKRTASNDFCSLVSGIWLPPHGVSTGRWVTTHGANASSFPSKKIPALAIRGESMGRTGLIAQEKGGETRSPGGSAMSLRPISLLPIHFI